MIYADAIFIVTDLAPNERGLVTTSERPIWTFPNDYIERLKTALMTANPNIFKGNQGNP